MVNGVTMEKHRPSSVVIVNSITPDGRPLSVVCCPLSAQLYHCPLTGFALPLSSSIASLRMESLLTVVRCPLSAQLYRCLSSTPAHRALRSAASSTTAERAVGAFCATWCGGCCRGFAIATVVRNGIAVGGRIFAIG